MRSFMFFYKWPPKIFFLFCVAPQGKFSGYTPRPCPIPFESHNTLRRWKPIYPLIFSTFIWIWGFFVVTTATRCCRTSPQTALASCCRAKDKGYFSI